MSTGLQFLVKATLFTRFVGLNFLPNVGWFDNLPTYLPENTWSDTSLYARRTSLTIPCRNIPATFFSSTNWSQNFNSAALRQWKLFQFSDKYVILVTISKIRNVLGSNWVFAFLRDEILSDAVTGILFHSSSGSKLRIFKRDSAWVTTFLCLITSKVSLHKLLILNNKGIKTAFLVTP